MGYNYSTYHEISELKEGSDIVITTLDRFKKIREKGQIFMTNLKYVVFDEIDTLIDAGFEEEVKDLTK